MPQDINLMHAGLTPRPEPFRSGQAGWILAGAVAVGWGGVLALQQLALQRSEQATTAEQELAMLQARVGGIVSAAPSLAATELRHLRETEAGQRQVRAALDSGVAGRTQGYAQYFMALSRQAQAGLWITGFSVAADGAALELQGRMTDPRRLPDYLRRLNNEPLFKGREFAQMSLQAVALDPADTSGAASGVTEFALRAKPANPQSSP